MRLGQVHGPGPIARGQLRAVDRLLFVRTIGHQRFDNAEVQFVDQGEGQIGSGHPFAQRSVQDERQLLTAIFFL